MDHYIQKLMNNTEKCSKLAYSHWLASNDVTEHNRKADKWEKAHEISQCFQMDRPPLHLQRSVYTDWTLPQILARIPLNFHDGNPYQGYVSMLTSAIDTKGQIYPEFIGDKITAYQHTDEVWYVANITPNKSLCWLSYATLMPYTRIMQYVPGHGQVVPTINGAQYTLTLSSDVVSVEPDFANLVMKFTINGVETAYEMYHLHDFAFVEIDGVFSLYVRYYDVNADMVATITAIDNPANAVILSIDIDTMKRIGFLPTPQLRLFGTKQSTNRSTYCKISTTNTGKVVEDDIFKSKDLCTKHPVEMWLEATTE